MTSSFGPIQFLPAQIQVFETLPSTNDYLKHVASASDGALPEGTVVWALEQTRGKGQNTKEWVSEAGKNITLSVLLRPQNILANEAFRLSKAMALAVQSTVAHFANSPVRIKWPNDIYLETQKIAGILIENSIQGEFVKYSVIGIGLNVNQTDFLSDNNPTSLLEDTSIKLDLQEVVDILLAYISARYLQLQLKNYKKIDGDYFQYLYQVYTEQTFTLEGKLKQCIINDVLPNGSIVLTTAQVQKAFLYGEAKWIL